MCSMKNVFVEDSMSKHKKMRKMLFLSISLPWLSNEIRVLNKLKQGLWCPIWLSYVYIHMSYVIYDSLG